MADESRTARASALEEKRRKLVEMRARRDQRGDASTTAARTAASSNLDEYIDGLLSAPAAVTNGQAESPPQDTASEANTPTLTAPSEAAPNTDLDNGDVIAVAAPAKEGPPGRQVVTFEAGTQTSQEDFPEGEHEEGEAQVITPIEESTEDNDALLTEEQLVAPKVLTQEEREEAVTSLLFSSFLNTASKKVERVLGAPVLADLLVNFVGENDGLESGVEAESDGSRFVSAQEIFDCPKWTAFRDVTDMDWSPLHRELMLSSYHMPSSSGSTFGSAALSAVSPDDTPSASMVPRSGELQSDGLVLVWSLAMPSRPEHIFACGSPVLKARFHPTEAPLVIGGCQSGQLVIWDIRAGRLPVQRSGQGHAHPISGMEFIEGGSGLVTTGTDGKINFWSLGNLRDPAESITVDGNLSSLAVAPESSTLLCGDEAGGLFIVPPAAAGGPRKRQIRSLKESHFGMVTSISTMSPKDGRAGLAKGFLRGVGGLVLTCGVDWTVKLWAPAYKDTPLLSLVSHSYDYMSDVQWNPAHQSLFATASSNGSVGLWNLAISLEEPIGSIVVSAEHGITSLKWSKDGRRLVISSGSVVHVWSMSEELFKKKGDEEARVMSQLVSRNLLPSL